MFKVCLQKMNEFFFSMIVFSFWFLGFCFFFVPFFDKIDFEKTRKKIKEEKHSKMRKTSAHLISVFFQQKSVKLKNRHLKKQLKTFFEFN